MHTWKIQVYKRADYIWLYTHVYKTKYQNMNWYSEKNSPHYDLLEIVRVVSVSHTSWEGWNCISTSVYCFIPFMDMTISVSLSCNLWVYTFLFIY